MKIFFKKVCFLRQYLKSQWTDTCVRKGYSVPETPSYGTRRIFGVRILFSTIHSPLQIERVLLRFIKLLGRTYIYHPESFRGHNSADNFASRGIKIKIDDGKALGP